MANRYFNQFAYSFHKMPVSIDMNVLIGATGAVTSQASIGVAAVVRSTTGIYRIQFQDNYTNLYGVNWGFADGVTGASVAGGSFVTGTAYQIVTLGTTTQAQWVTAGLPVGLVAAVGQVFVAAGAGAGTGTVKAVAHSGIFSVEILGSRAADIAPSGILGANVGGFVFVGTYNASGALADPTDGCNMWLKFSLSNSNSSVNGIL